MGFCKPIGARDLHPGPKKYQEVDVFLLTRLYYSDKLLMKVGTTLRVLGEFVLFGKRKAFGTTWVDRNCNCPGIGEKDLNE